MQNKLLQWIGRIKNEQEDLYQALRSKQLKVANALQSLTDLEAKASQQGASLNDLRSEWDRIEGHDEERRRWEAEAQAFHASIDSQRDQIRQQYRLTQNYYQWIESAMNQAKMVSDDLSTTKRELQKIRLDDENLAPYEQKLRQAVRTCGEIRTSYNAKAKDFALASQKYLDLLRDAKEAVLAYQRKAATITDTVIRQVAEERRAKEEADRKAAQQRAEEERRARTAERAQQRAEEERQRAAEKEVRDTKQASFLEPYHAMDLSDYRSAFAFWNNPFAYQGKSVFLVGGYHKHIGPNAAIVAIVPDRNPAQYIVQWDTSRNLAELAVNGSPYVRCVVEVLGTIHVQHGLQNREIPHVKEIACLK